MLHLGMMTTCAASVVVIYDQAPSWPSELVYLADHDALAGFGCCGVKARRFQSIVGIEKQQVRPFQLPPHGLQPFAPPLLTSRLRPTRGNELSGEHGAGKDVGRLQFPNTSAA